MIDEIVQQIYREDEDEMRKRMESKVRLKSSAYYLLYILFLIGIGFI